MNETLRPRRNPGSRERRHAGSQPTQPAAAPLHTQCRLSTAGFVVVLPNRLLLGSGDVLVSSLDRYACHVSVAEQVSGSVCILLGFWSHVCFAVNLFWILRISSRSCFAFCGFSEGRVLCAQLFCGIGLLVLFRFMLEREMFGS